MHIPTGPKFRGMPQTAEERSTQADQKLRDVADMYEKHFMNEMMKAMRSTVSESGFIKVNQGEKIFREQLDQEYVDAWSKKGGIGFSKIIYDQLVEKYGAQLGIQKDSAAPPQGPLPVSEENNLKMRHSQNGDRTTYQFSPNPESKPSKALPVQSPWTGRLVQKVKLSADEYFLKINHENGIQSDLKWNGLLSQVNEGDQLNEGQVLGYLNPDFQTMLWSLSEKNVSE